MVLAVGFEPYRAAAAAWGGPLLASYNVAARLAAIRAPTLVVVGDDDVICPPSQARLLEAGIRGAWLELIPNCGHFPFIERPAAFLGAVARWLDRHGEGGATVPGADSLAAGPAQ